MKLLKNKKSIILVLSLFIIGLILIGSGSYIKHQSKKEKPEQKEYENLSPSSQIVQDLFFMTRGNNSSSLFLGTDYYNIYYSQDETDLSKTNVTFKKMLSYYMLDNDLILYDETKQQLSFKSSDLKEQYIKIFGDSSDYYDDDIYCNCPGNLTYDEQTKTYINQDLGYGFEHLEGYENKIIEARKYNDRIEIYEKVAFYKIDYDQEKTEYYKDCIYHEKIASVELEETVIIDNYLSILDTYKYTFEQSEDTYYFAKVEIVK